MADATQTAIDATADAAKATAAAAGEPAKQATATTTAAASASKRTPKRKARTARATVKAAKTVSKTQRRAKARRSTTAKGAPKAAAKERINDVNFDSNNWFAGFGAMPAAAPFQALFAEAGERSQEAVRRSQKAAEQLADLSRANAEALVDAGKIAVEGVRSIGQDVVESSREGVEQAAGALRALAEAKSATEFVQLQTEFARASFDRFVAESSRLTESVVKLAGETIQPISTRATLNAERINQIVA